MMRYVLISIATVLLMAAPVSAQVVGQGSPATTSDAAAWPVKVVFGNAQIDPRAVTVQNASLTVDSELAAAAALTDNYANPTAGAVGAFTMVWDGGNWDRWTGAVAALGAIADGAAASTAPVRIAGKDGSGNTQDIITDTSGELQVDVLTLPNVTVGTFPDNEPINVAQFGGSNTVTGHGPSGSGIPRVTGSEENMTGTVSLTSGAACPASSATAATTSAGCVVVPLAGYVGVGWELASGLTGTTINWQYSGDGGSNFSQAIAVVGGVQDLDGASATGGQSGHFVVGEGWTHVRVFVSAFGSGSATLTVNATKIISPLAVGALAANPPGTPPGQWASYTGIRSATNTPTAVTATTVVGLTGDVYGITYARQDHPARIRCTVAVSTATTIQAVGGSCAAPGASLSIYITDIHFATSAAAGTAADSFPTLKYGTGGTCGTGTVIFWGALTTANSTVVNNLSTPIKIPANNEVCWIMTTAGSKFIVLEGYIAP